ncbi:hypothetical protein R3X27_23350 [Tropicimonas sp. TH_r6]|uniref:hypothetical protein n=1 Tax=Tropicimonas sp. TH_r6 TaxID=3082085 RepID=UPI002953155A|nr:hypothetical protein [Tropicimonas sp. TH_r6]MDV7145630.1 hypothetical protein [Tropicimonas sp. TH_r6]
MTSESSISDYRAATLWLCDQIESMVKDGQLQISQCSFAEYVMGISVGLKSGTVRSILCSKGRPFIYVEDEIARELIELAKSEPELFDLCSSICAKSLLAGANLSSPFADFAGKILSGSQERPKVRNRPRKRNWAEQYFIFCLVQTAHHEFGLTTTRNDEGGQTSACDAVAESLTVCGRKTPYGRVKDLMVGTSYKNIRSEFDVAARVRGRKARLEASKNADEANLDELEIRSAREDLEEILSVRQA